METIKIPGMPDNLFEALSPIEDNIKNLSHLSNILIGTYTT